MELLSCNKKLPETLEVPADEIVAVAKVLHDDHKFTMLIDLCGVDYLGQNKTARFAIVYHLLNIAENKRIRLRSFVTDKIASVTAIWPNANWYEREVFDMFGIEFSGHPKLERLLTDYGFLGHPLCKDYC